MEENFCYSKNEKFNGGKVLFLTSKGNYFLSQGPKWCKFEFGIFIRGRPLAGRTIGPSCGEFEGDGPHVK
jgi:hypothetical protein